MDIILIMNLVLLAVLIALTAFFVGSEFAVVKVRMSRIDQMIAEGNKKALMAKKVAQDLDYYLSACQLGITVTAIGLGALGKPTVEKILYPVFEQFAIGEATASIISFVIAYAIVTYLHVVVGELAPKTLAIQFAEKMTLLLAPGLVWFGKIMFPAIWLLNGSARILLKMFGVKPASHEQVHSEEELKIIMAQSFEGGEINKQELDYVENIFAFDNRVTKDIFVPRIQLISLDNSMSMEEIIAVLDEHNYTRYPVTDHGDKDHIIGYVNVKKMLTSIAAGRKAKLEDYIQPIPLVHKVTPVQKALKIMQENSAHMALVIDEFGGTAGIITMEDILEEIVGEIRDEYDEDELPEMEKINDNEYHLSGRLLLSTLEEELGLQFDDTDEIDTIGGWIQFKHANLLEKDDVLTLGNNEWTILETDNYQIIRIALRINVPATILE